MPQTPTCEYEEGYTDYDGLSASATCGANAITIHAYDHFDRVPYTMNTCPTHAPSLRAELASGL